jgi:hypothetical protein
MKSNQKPVSTSVQTKSKLLAFLLFSVTTASIAQDAVSPNILWINIDD